ncbi:MAG TPA: extracellular solute-binding protein [Candidatus Eisenbacteria bacterium]|nr:extracellular solute-binding protein [Candidatus Eisenbacteria bacterium]
MRALALAAAALVGLGACAAGGGTAIATGPVTIEFATHGLGQENDATNRAVAAFEREEPRVHVNVLTLPASADLAYRQLTDRLAAGGPTPDVLTLDVIWPAALARSGWITPLDRFRPARAGFFPAQVEAGTYRGRLYAVPWFINAEGLYYRTDLVPGPPASAGQLVDAAAAAMRDHPEIAQGLAFEGDRYEGAVTAFIDFAGGLDLRRVDSAQNVLALTYMRDAIARDRISPPAVTTWQEADVQDAFLSGQAVFALNWPYVFALAEAPGSPVQGRTAWIPFPSVDGVARAALGGSMLAINARSPHQDAAWRFVRYLLRDDVQIDRAATAGDPPAVRSAYGQRLFDLAPYYREEQRVLSVTTSRPIDPRYVRISDVLQRWINAVLAGQAAPDPALAAAQGEIDAIRRGP